MASIKRIGKYDVIETIGRGGMGVVLKATDPQLGRLVAIKIMTDGFSDDPDLLKRFYREAQSTASLSHPNIVTVYDMGEQDGMPYLVMQFLEGESLYAIIKSRRELSLLTKTNYLLQICNGLRYAHEQQITHRDIKPANIMVLPDGTVKIVDFGIARIGNDKFTRPGQVMGSFHYMSPEQINEQEVDARSDIFALGIVAFEFLTFALPFQGQDVSSTLMKILRAPLPPLSTYLKEYPAGLDAILERALAKNKEDRYQTVEEMSFDLARIEMQLRKEMIVRLDQGAERLISEGAFGRAKEQLQHLIKLDPQNHGASQRLRNVQLEIHKQARIAQACQLRLEAEQVLARQDFETALRLLDQAIALDPDQLELTTLRDSAAEQKNLQKLVRDSMDEAQAARKAGDLEGALRSLEQLLAMQSGNPDALRLKGEVALEIAERDKQRQLHILIAEARREISSRQFSAAQETLKKVAELDRDAPGLRELLQLAADGVEQELRRRAVERATTEVTEALDRPDPLLACSLAEAALKKFPADRGLLKLKALAEEQAEAHRRHLWLGEQMTFARALLESGKSSDALVLLESAWQKYPGEGDLESLMSIVRTAIQHEQSERRRVEYTQLAREALRRKNFSEAIHTLEIAKSETKSHFFDELLRFAKEEEAQFEIQKKVDAAAAKAQQLMNSADYEQAVHFLESALEELPHEDLRFLAATAKRQLADYILGLEHLITTAKQLTAQGRPAAALNCLAAQRATYNREARFQAALAEASQQQQRREVVAKAVAAIRAGLEGGELEAAERQLGVARRDLGDLSEWRQLEEELQNRRSRSIQKQMETALNEAENLVRLGADAEALANLQSAEALVDKVPQELSRRYRDLKSSLSRRLEAASKPRAAGEAVREMDSFDREWRRFDQKASVQGPTEPGVTLPRYEPGPSPASPRVQKSTDKIVDVLTPPPRTLPPDSGSVDSLFNGRGGNRDATILPPTRGGSGESANSETRSGAELTSNVNASLWPDDFLRAVERQLASFIGSLARVVVKRAASRTTDLKAFYAILDATLESKADREAFHARRIEPGNLPKSQVVPEPSQLSAPVIPQREGASVELTPAAIDRAAHLLARHIGPIAVVHARRSAQRADSLRALYILLAEHVEMSERSRFLRDAGFPNS